MKKLLTALALLIFFGVRSQNAHPTIDTMEVSYMTASVSGTVTNVLAQPIISLKTLTGVTKVHCKIMNSSDSTIIYSVSYPLSTSPVVNASGQTLFIINGQTIQILSPNPMELKNYTYQVQTEDTGGNLTAPYIYQHIVQ